MTGTSATDQVILYFTGNISLSGSTNIVHTGRAVDLTLSGLPESADGSCTSTQTVTLSGGSAGSNLFAHFPCGTVGIDGGAGAGGDITGAVWAKEWNGSSGNGAQLVVPDDFPFDLSQTKGDAYAVSINEYIAIGVNDWVSLYD